MDAIGNDLSRSIGGTIMNGFTFENIFKNVAYEMCNEMGWRYRKVKPSQDRKRGTDFRINNFRIDPTLNKEKGYSEEAPSILIKENKFFSCYMRRSNGTVVFPDPVLVVLVKDVVSTEDATNKTKAFFLYWFESCMKEFCSLAQSLNYRIEQDTIPADVIFFKNMKAGAFYNKNYKVEIPVFDDWNTLYDFYFNLHNPVKIIRKLK